jgi:hypothetical protein
MAKVQDLTTEFITAALLYRMIEKEEAIPLILAKTDLEFVENEMNALVALGAVEANAEDSCWDVTDKGEEIFDRLLDTYEALIDLDIFSGVNLSLDLEDELFDDDGLVLADKTDPRFDEPVNEDEAEVFGTTDLRLAVLDFLAEKASLKAKKPFDAKNRHDVLARVVFIQELGNDKFIDDKAFFDLKLGGIAAEIDGVVSSVPPWIELAKEFDPPQKLMEMIIEAGFRDAQKREMLEDKDECVWLDAQKQSKVLESLLHPLVS